MKGITIKFLKTYLTVAGMIIVLMCAAAISVKHIKHRDQAIIKVVKDEETMSNLDFNVDANNGKTVIIKNGKGKTIIINGEAENSNSAKSSGKNGETETKTIVIHDEKEKGDKKVIVSTSVTIVDDSTKTLEKN
jgi:hypothetical protein